MSGRLDHMVVREPVALLRGGLAVAAVFLFYTSLDNYGLALGGPKPWLWVLAFAAAAAGLLVIEPSRPLPALRSPLAWWMVFFFGLTVAWMPSLRGYEEVWQVLYDRTRSLITLAAFVLIFDEPRARRAAMLAVAGCVVLAAAMNVAEFLGLLSFTAGLDRVPGRSAGFYFNANGSALAIALGVAVVAEQVGRSWRVPLLLVSLIGVATTFSRSGMLCLALVLVWLLWRRALGTWSFALGLLFGAWLVTFALAFAASNGLLNENTASRLHLAQDDSGRIELALKAWNLFLDSPWTGKGLGATVVWDEQVYSHNMYVTLGAEQGILGLLAFPAFGLALLASNRSAAGFALVLMAAGFFSHGLLDSRVTLLLAALASVPAAAGLLPEPDAFEGAASAPP